MTENYPSELHMSPNDSDIVYNHMDDHCISPLSDYALDQRFDVLADYMDYYIDYLCKKAVGPTGIISMSHPFSPHALIEMYEHTGTLIYNSGESVEPSIETIEPFTLEQWEKKRIESVVTY